MNLMKSNKAAIGLAVALAIASAFTLSSFAASNAGRAAAGENPGMRVGKSLLNAPSGRALGTGRFTIDGVEARSGAAVLSGSTIATGPDANVTVDLGQLGRIELLPNTAVTLVLSDKLVEVSMKNSGSIVQSLSEGVTGQVKVQGEHAKLAVTQGRAEVKSAENTRTVQAGEESALGPGAEVVASGNTVITVDAGSDNASTNAPVKPPKGGYVTPGMGGYIGLAAVATGVSLGVMAGSNDEEARPRPSPVVP